VDPDLEALIDALELLAADPADQAPALPLLRRAAEELRAGVADLLPVDRVLLRRDAIPRAAAEVVVEIDREMEALLEDRAAWSATALDERPQWREIRRLARHALAVIRARRPAVEHHSRQ
jgi:hypothetical protein